MPGYNSYAAKLHLIYTCLTVERLQRENAALKYISVQDEHVLQEKKINCVCYSQSIAKFLCQLVDAEIAENSYGAVPKEKTKDKSKTMMAL